MTEKLTCPSDLASKAESEFLEDNLKAIRDLVPQEKHELTPEDLECIQCSGSISEGRAKLGMDTCIDCARENERYSKQYNRKPSRSYDYDD